MSLKNEVDEFLNDEAYKFLDELKDMYKAKFFGKDSEYIFHVSMSAFTSLIATFVICIVNDNHREEIPLLLDDISKLIKMKVAEYHDKLSH